MSETSKSNPRWREVLKTVAPIVAVLIAFKVVTVVFAPNPVNHKDLEEAWASNDIVLLEFHASWCSTCLMQRSSLNYVLSDKKFSKIKRFTLNFDKEKALEADFRVNAQSTLILMRGHKEIARNVGVVSPSDLAGFLNTVVVR